MGKMTVSIRWIIYLIAVALVLVLISEHCPSPDPPIAHRHQFFIVRLGALASWSEKEHNNLIFMMLNTAHKGFHDSYVLMKHYTKLCIKPWSEKEHTIVIVRWYPCKPHHEQDRNVCTPVKYSSYYAYFQRPILHNLIR